MIEDDEQNVAGAVAESLMQIAAAAQLCEASARHNRDEMVSNGWSAEAAEEISLDMFYAPLRKALSIDDGER